MKYKARKGQASYGEAIGILLLDQYSPFIPGDVGNATTYDFPVRFRKVDNLSVKRALAQDQSAYHDLLHGARELVGQGVRAITGSCGFLGIHQKKMVSELDVPVFLSSLLQINLISRLVGPEAKIGIITADSAALGISVLEAVGIHSMENLIIAGMEDEPAFRSAVLEESGTLDAEKIERETVEVADRLRSTNPSMRAILLECSMLPPYAKAVQEKTGLPVFDFITMIRYVYSAVVQRRYIGSM